MATKRDYYEILGLEKAATKPEIKSAYRKMALKFHPDKNKAKDAEEKFKEINEAYQVLSDSKKKSSYDQFGHAAFSGAGGMGGNPFAGGAQQGPFTWNYSSSSGGNPFGGGADFGDAFDIFEQFFGGGGFGARQRRTRYSMRIDFMEAAKGATKEVEIEGTKHKIKIPAGANDGTRLRFEEFDVSFDVAPHERFKRDGYDIFIDQKINFTIAALGGKVEVPTLDKPLQMKVRAGTQSHTLVRLKSEGITRLRGRGRGDLYVRLIVEIPTKLSGKQKKVLKELEELG
jgi:molecular chaperone DnaJ